eukprot:CAMPEP_0177786704 /NCGR_PEP_ID=MMETSP0491_2-20121128/21074_1 /TAXON_ID=63592 /ORGANISM="Tetraselmis chuii, Strain PLY429" /LENGTH=59 /DNA_ID=CAMNT_0019307951 /DNA_START=44 /DNA_END=223 /DNA_ORIENTATION=+
MTAAAERHSNCIKMPISPVALDPIRLFSGGKVTVASTDTTAPTPRNRLSSASLIPDHFK